eukprot:15360748-Ditylum_brightwellii.AAC.1
MDNTIKALDPISQSLHGPEPVFQTQQNDLYLPVIQHGTTKAQLFFQLIVDHKQLFDPGGPKFQYHINPSIDGIYFNRLFDPGGGPIGKDCYPFVNVDTTIIPGIEHAKEMDFADSGLADAIWKSRTKSMLWRSTLYVITFLPITKIIKYAKH